MAKAPEQTSAPTANGPVGFKPLDVGAAGRSDSRSIMLTVPMADGSERQMSRTDYIKTRADQGASRGVIRKEVALLQGKDIPYQTVFQATKNHPTYAKKGGKGKVDLAEGEGAAGE
jgi:hypothetical protein